MRKCYNKTNTTGNVPLSTLTEYNGLVFLSGVVAANPLTGKIEGNASQQAALIMENVENILNDIHMSLDDILKVTIYLQDMESFTQVNDAYSLALNVPYPSRTCVEVSRLPLGALVEMDVICGRP